MAYRDIQMMMIMMIELTHVTVLMNLKRVTIWFSTDKCRMRGLIMKIKDTKNMKIIISYLKIEGSNHGKLIMLMKNMKSTNILLPSKLKAYYQRKNKRKPLIFRQAPLDITRVLSKRFQVLSFYSRYAWH